MTKRKKMLTDIPVPNLVAQTEKPEATQNAIEPTTQNGLADAMGFGGGPFGGSPGMPAGGGSPEQLSDTTTIFRNLRWYLISNFRQVLNQCYAEIGLIRTIVDLPVDDALRGGIEIKTKLLDENEIKELQNSIEYDNDLGTAGWAGKWDRLFGGAGILILVDDQDPETELELSSIGPDTDVKFKAVDMWELFWDKQNAEGYDRAFESEMFEFYDYYGEKVHKSRVMKLKGLEAPSFIRPRLRGWGLSVVENLVRSINQYLKASDLTFEVLDEFKIDVYKIKNLVSTLLSPNGQSKVQQRIQLANWQKNYQNAVVMDAEDDWDHKQLSFAGLAEAQTGIRKQVAADMRMPISKLFGASESTGSLGNGDQNDMENYNSMVESSVRTPIKFHILKLVQIKCQKLFGFIPDDLEIAFKSLRVLSAVDEETVKTQKFTRLKAAKDTGDITTQEFRDACNKGNLLDIQLDTKLDQLDSDDPQIEAVLSGENEEEDDTPGGDREDSESTSAKKNSFDESKHPRAEDGQFGPGGADGSSSGDKSEKKVRVKKEKKKPAEMSAAEIKKGYHALREKSSQLTDKLVDAGFGSVKPSEMRERATENPLFAQYVAISDAMHELMAEAKRRYGPNLASIDHLGKIHGPMKNENSKPKFRVWRKGV